MNADQDRQDLFDLHAVVQALEIAQEALRKAMEGQGREARAQFVYQIGFARGRLQRISERIDEALEDVRSYICPGCGSVSYNPIDIQARYCERCHQFGDDDAP